MKLISALFTLAVVTISSVSAQTGSFTNWTDCANNPSRVPVVVTSASFTPYPVCIGGDYCFQITGTSSVPITQGAKIYTVVNAAGRFYPNGNQTDMCTLLAESGTPCPIPAGPVSLKFCHKNAQVSLKNYKLFWMFGANDANGQSLFCQNTIPVDGRDANGAPLALYAKQC
ncbi:hypothetical protein EC991_002138 [Linnemannia zychae]|nr:hypothetical protein EC991_002138 [Linnemannia zychae]